MHMRFEASFQDFFIILLACVNAFLFRCVERFDVCPVCGHCPTIGSDAESDAEGGGAASGDGDLAERAGRAGAGNWCDHRGRDWLDHRGFLGQWTVFHRRYWSQLMSSLLGRDFGQKQAEILTATITVLYVAGQLLGGVLALSVFRNESQAQDGDDGSRSDTRGQ